MSLLLVSPVLIPLATAALCLLAWNHPRWQRIIALGGALVLLGAALSLTALVWRDGIMASALGGWRAPYGIVFVADLFGCLMTTLAALLGLATVIYSGATMDARRVRFGYYPVMQILLMGVCGAFLTGDLFNLYVWFEVLLMASFVLLVLGGERAQLEGAIKYVALNLLSSTLFLTALGLLYGKVGTLNMADVAVKLRATDSPELVTVLAMLFLVAFGIKAGVFPLFFWLPASYHTPPIAISSLFAGILTKVGVYALVRVFTLIFVQNAAYTNALLLGIAGASMIVGVLGALAHTELRRILSFLIVSQIGYMIMGLGLSTQLSLAGTVFYVAHHIVAETTLFFLAGVLRRNGGSYELSKLGGFFAASPFLAILFALPALSLAGIPPFSGFFAKLILLRAALDIDHFLIAAISLVAGLLTLLVLIRIWSEAFWKKAPEGEPLRGAPRSMLAPVAAFAAISVLLGAGAGPLFAFSQRAAQQLVDPTQYVRAVLGEDGVVALEQNKLKTDSASESVTSEAVTR